MTVWDPNLIVVGVDGSEASQHAASTAVEMARRSGATLHLVTVVRPPEGWWGIVGSPPTPAALTEALEDAQKEILDRVVEHLDLDGVKHETVEDMGDPGRVLAAYCEEQDADLLVVGRRGAGFIERLVIGSVANKVVNDAPCPVLVIP
ncbi:MAG: universal stress protein [Acidimicrobiia bacterium]|nr:universal stress protein [Acidimicrobiia bacterium]